MSAEGVTTAAGQAKRARVIELVIAGVSVNEAAEKVGVSRRHAFRLISDPEARAEIARAARESAKSAQLVLQRGAEEAARALVSMGTGKSKATPAKVAACRGVLDFVLEKAATHLNVSAARAPVPESFVAGATSVLERALAEAEAADRDEESVGAGTTADPSATVPQTVAFGGEPSDKSSAGAVLDVDAEPAPADRGHSLVVPTDEGAGS